MMISLAQLAIVRKEIPASGCTHRLILFQIISKQL